MTTAAQWMENERRERLCKDGVTAVEMYSMDGAAPADLAQGNTEALDLIEGLILYAQLLEAYILFKANVDPAATRAAAKDTAAAWRGISHPPVRENG